MGRVVIAGSSRRIKNKLTLRQDLWHTFPEGGGCVKGRSPRVNVSISEKDHADLVRIAVKVGISYSQLCRNLIRYALTDLRFIDKMKVTDLARLLRKGEESGGRGRRLVKF